MASLLKVAREISLRTTWRYARQASPYYRERLPDLADEEIQISTLATLPVLTKHNLAENLESLHASRRLPAYMLFTGGTTGPAQVVYGGESDLDATCSRFQESRSAGNCPLTLMLSGGSQGAAPLVPGRIGHIAVPLLTRRGYEWAWRMLTTEFRYEGFEPRVTRLLLPTPAVKKLVHFILERGYDPSLLSLNAICTFSWYLSSGWRKRIEEILGAPVVDVYGFTEVATARAFECAECNQYHFDERIIWEAVDPVANAPIETGLGKLLVTSLYPYSQEVVLFRYDSGDLIEVGVYCESYGDRGFRFRGRLSQVITIEIGGERLYPLLPTDVQELLDTHHWVARSENLRHSGVTITEDESFPKWRMRRDDSGGPPVGRLEIEMKSSPHLFGAEWEAFRQQLETGLLRLNPALREALERGLMSLDIVGLPPGHLEESDIFIC